MRAAHASVLRAAFLAMALGQVGCPVLAQIPLPSRTVLPSAETTTEFLKAFRISSAETEHALATFVRHPSPEERRSLEASGIRVLAPLVGTTYRVRVDKRVNVRAASLVQLKASLTRLTAEDRVDPNLWRERYSRYAFARPGQKQGNYVLNPDGTLNLSVRVHFGVTEAEIRSALEKHARHSKREGDQTWFAVVPRTSLRSLAAEDIVQWIDAGPLPFIPENDSVRAAIKVDAVQGFDPSTGKAAGLSGKGVRVGVFDKGVDETHDDFDDAASATRVITNDAGMQFHATHVAGTIAGDGKLSTGSDSWGGGNGGTAAYQWRGMATSAQVLDIDQMPPFGQSGKDPDTHMRYISSPGMDVSNHSYVISVDGAYDSSNQARDEIIRGDAMSGGNPVPPRLHVTSAGNGGQTPFSNEYVTSHQSGYFALTKQVKNALVVGNWDTGAGRIANSSSLGPTYDGRIKPDVVAPGMAVKSTGYCVGPSDPDEKTPDLCKDSTGNYKPRQNFYRVLNGTSMASAAAAGTLALVLEQYATTYGVSLDQSPPLPSTLRAVVIHAADDKKNSAPTTNPDGVVKDSPGPDFVTGWGLIDAQAAVDVVANRRLREDALMAACDSHTYIFAVAPDTGARVRVTLAWDDVAADALVGATDPTAPKLRNDLDLVLVDPDGTEHYPWQLDQTIVDSAGRAIPSELQHCGTPITVQRKLMPAPDPAAANESVADGSLPVAGRGPDHLNNVEVVDIDASAVVAGTWQARVSGFAIAQGPQRFSLVGGSFLRLLQGPKVLCVRYPALCQKIAFHVDLCDRYPKLCEPRFKLSVPGRIRVYIDDAMQKIVLPLDEICRYAAGPLDVHCAGYDLRVESTAAPFRAAVYAANGQLVRRDNSDSLNKRFAFEALGGGQQFLVLSLGRGLKPKAELEISLAPR